MRSVAVLGLALAVPLALVSAQQLTATERAEAVATIWAEARYNFASWDRVRADWDSALTANLKLAAQVQSDVLFYRRLRRLVALLGDGQAGVIPPAHLRSRIARPPLLLESVEQRPLILEYAENDEMRVARPERLAEIVAVQGVPAESWIHDSVLPEISAATPPDRWQRAVQWMLQGEKGTTLHLLLRLPGGEQRGISVTRSVSLNDRWPLERPELEIDSLPGGVVRVRVNALAEEDVVRRFDRAFPDFAGVTGLILDLRYAASGESRYGYAILARLTARPFPAARWRTPQYRPVFGLLMVRPAPRHRFAPHRAGGIHRTGRGAGLERDGRRGGGPARGIPERSARRDHRGDVSRQSRRGAHDRASQKLGDAAVGDTPCVSQRGRVCGEGHPAGAPRREHGR